MNNPRAVFDANVLVSAALLRNSTSRQAVDLAISLGTILFSEPTFFEVDAVLRRSKFDRYVSEQVRLEFLASILNEAEIVPITQSVSDCRDPKDNMVLEVAVCGQATEVVSGDKDLLALNPFRGIAIVTPVEFIERWKTLSDG